MRVLPVRAWLVGWDPERKRAEWLPPGGPEPFPLELGEIGGGLLHGALNEDRRAGIADIDAAPDHPESRYLRKGGGDAWAFLPLTGSRQTAGCLILRAARAEALSEERIGVLDPVLPMAAAFIRIGMLHRELEGRVEERTTEISLLYGISRALGFVVSAEDMFYLLGSSLREALAFDICGFLLLLPNRREMSLHLSASVSDQAMRKFRRIASAEAKRRSGRSPGRLVSQVSQIVPFREDTVIGPSELRSVAHAPLYVRGEMVGLLTVASRERDSFGEAQTRLLYTIANQASQTLDRLRTSHEAESSKIRSMLASMPEGVLLLDAELRPVMTNRAAKEYVTEINGGPEPSTLTRLGDVELGDLMGEMERPGAGPRSFEIPGREDKIFSMTCSPVRGLEGRCEGMVVVLSDVTEARRVQLQLAQSEKLSALGEMISGVAHELNNPLATMMGHAQLLQNMKVEEDIRRRLDAIASEASRCRKIVRKLLSFVRPPVPDRGPFDINGAIDSVIQLLGHQFQVEDIELQLDLDPELRPVTGDSHLIQQVFLNIICNAFHAMTEKGGPGKLMVRTRNDHDRVCVEISDNGPGMAPQTRNRIFDPFFTTKEVGRGTGLGLFLAYGTIREHGGTIDVVSQLGAGATFTVELPATPRGAEKPATPASTPAQERKEHEEAFRLSPAVVPTGKRILIVEDEASLAEVMAEVLQLCGHTVDVACDGRTARSVLASAPYDLIISDLKMPNMNGRDFYKHVIETRPDLARRIIFSTGDTANPATKAFFEEVGNPYLPKPFNLADLIRLVGSILGSG